jgi:hypothetical protein
MLKMKTRNKTGILVLIAASLFCLSGMPTKDILAEEKEVVFENDLRYDLYYVLEDQMQLISNVRIVDKVKIEGAIFLAIQSPGVTSGKLGYVALSRVRVILPTGAPKPQNIGNK